MKARWTGVAALAFALAGCRAHKPVKTPAEPTVDLTTIHRVAVMKFEGQGGQAVADEFVKQLLADGYQVVDRHLNPQAVLTGIVTDYQSASKRLVFLGISTATVAGQTAVITNPMLTDATAALSSSEGSSFGLPDVHIVAVRAMVGVIARLTDPSGRPLFWGDEYAYEGLELPAVTQTVIGVLSRSMRDHLASGKTAS